MQPGERTHDTARQGPGRVRSGAGTWSPLDASTCSKAGPGWWMTLWLPHPAARSPSTCFARHHVQEAHKAMTDLRRDEIPRVRAAAGQALANINQQP